MRLLCRLLVFLPALLVFRPGLSIGDDGEAESLHRLVFRLGSARHAEREAAARLLDARGVEALPALRQARQSQDAEVRRRAGQLIERIEKRIQAAQLLAGKRVRLRYRNKPVFEAVADIARQTGYTIELDGDRTGLVGRTVTLDTGDVTFWEALDMFCRKAGLDERASGGAFPPPDEREIMIRKERAARWKRVQYAAAQPRPAGPILLQDRNPSPVPTCRAGAIRIRALPPGPHEGPLFAHAAGEVLAKLEVTPEPRLAWLGVVRLGITRAVDDQGRVLTQPEPFLADTVDQAEESVVLINAATGQPVLPADSFRYLPVRLKGPDRPAILLKEVRGILTIRLQTVQPLLEVSDILHAQGRTLKGEEGTSLTVLQVRREQGGALHLAVRQEVPRTEVANQVVRVRPGMVAFRRRVSDVSGQLVLQDEKGKAWTMASRNSTITAMGQASMTVESYLTFQPDQGQGEPARLLYTIHHPIILDVPFRLEDVPLRAWSSPTSADKGGSGPPVLVAVSSPPNLMGPGQVIISSPADLMLVEEAVRTIQGLKGLKAPNPRLPGGFGTLRPK
jgi:hypothetical protein